MFGRLFGFDDFVLAGLLARRAHSRWLTNAMKAGVRVPRIPVRRVSEGGYDPLMATTEGREWAEAWWSETLEDDALV